MEPARPLTELAVMHLHFRLPQTPWSAKGIAEMTDSCATAQSRGLDAAIAGIVWIC